MNKVNGKKGKKFQHEDYNRIELNLTLFGLLNKKCKMTSKNVWLNDFTELKTLTLVRVNDHGQRPKHTLNLHLDPDY